MLAPGDRTTSLPLPPPLLGLLTVTFADLVTPSIAAVIAAVPAPTAVTSPDDETVATEALFEDQLTVRPSSACPLASRAVAVAWVVCPTVSDAELSETDTEATGTGSGSTVTVTESLWSPSFATILVCPAFPARTRPWPFTVAIVVSADCQARDTPSIGAPAESSALAVSWVDPPGARTTASCVIATALTGVAGAS